MYEIAIREIIAPRGFDKTSISGQYMFVSDIKMKYLPARKYATLSLFFYDIKVLCVCRPLRLFYLIFSLVLY